MRRFSLGFSTSPRFPANIDANEIRINPFIIIFDALNSMYMTKLLHIYNEENVRQRMNPYRNNTWLLIPFYFNFDILNA